MHFDHRSITRRGAVAASFGLALAPFVASARRLPDDATLAGDSAALKPTLATVYTGRVDPSLCLVSEKYDGVRALWDGRLLRHRSGRVVAAPARFLAALPGVALDGELWLGRGRFDALSGVVRRTEARVDEWHNVRYMVFDLPGADGTFAERAGRLAGIVANTGTRQLEAVPQMRVDDPGALQRRLAATVAAGGEGLMLHVAGATWAPGRSEALMKLKAHLDAEAMVVGYRPGTGKYGGQVGALEVRSGEGRHFLVGSGLSEALRREPPALGDVVTYRYRDLTSSGLPRFATYLRNHHAL